MNFLRTYEGFWSELFNSLLGNFNVGDYVRFVKSMSREPYSGKDTLKIGIWQIYSIDKRDSYWYLENIDNGYKTSVFLNELDELEKLEPHEIEALKYNL